MNNYVIYNLILLIIAFLCFNKSLSRITLLTMGGVNFLVANLIYINQFAGEATLRGAFGVHLVIDGLSRNFLLMNAVVWLASTMVGIKKKRNTVYYFFLALFLPVCNLAFVSGDLFNIYVVLELITLITFLLSSTTSKTKQFWAAMKYIILCTAAMNLYLLGVGMHFLESGTFDLSKEISNLPAGLIIAGLLAKAGVFFYSMWLIDLHSNAEPEISALLSGISIKGAVYALMRLQPIISGSYRIVVIFGVVSAITGVFFAMNEKNYKRILAQHTLSQVGYILVSPSSGAIYALAHGVFKSFLFLFSDELPSLDIEELLQKRLAVNKWLFLALASLTISGMPLTIGAAAKDMVLSTLTWQKPLMYIACIGTVASFAKFLFLPSARYEKIKNLPSYLLLSFYCLTPFVNHDRKFLSPILLILTGILFYFIVRRFLRPLPRTLENINNSAFLYIILVLICVVVSVNA